nr:MAG TPA: TRAF PROTEIN, TRAO PROTEIN, TRAN ADHESION, BACTERIAL SECRETION.5A [Caudoviricetes sp.]
MVKFMKKLAMICAAVLLAGCSFNHADRGVAFMGDKAYYVPVESVGYPVTRDMEKYLKNIGIYFCTEGDAFWVSKYDFDRLKQAGSDYLLKDYFAKYLAGCTKPLTWQEVLALTGSSQASYDWQDAGIAWQNVFYNSAAAKQDAASIMQRENENLNYRLQQQQQGRFYQIPGL